MPHGRAAARRPRRQGRPHRVHAGRSRRSRPASRRVHDADLAVSWHHDIETVPTLIRVVDGAEVERTVGWSRAEWQRITGLDGLGEDLPVDAARVRVAERRPRPRRRAARALRGRAAAVAAASSSPSSRTTSRRCSRGAGPTACRSCRRPRSACCGCSTARPAQPDEVVATVPPDLVDVTVEKVAIAAVMAGCLPEYLPWVLTVIEAICTDEFNIHGVLATTMPVGPVIVASGPGTRAIGMNAGVNALGQGNRANLTIGRAVQLVVRNVGGGRPGRGRPGGARQPGQAVVLLRRARRLAVRHARREPRRDAGRRRHHRVRRRGPALHRRPDVADAGEPGDVAGVVPADAAPPEARAGLRRHPGRRPRARPGVRRGRLGPRQRCSPSSTPRLQIPGDELVARRRRDRRGRAGVVRRRDAAEVPARRHPARLRRRRRRAVLGDHRRLGQRGDRQPAGDQGGRDA